MGQNTSTRSSDIPYVLKTRLHRTKIKDAPDPETFRAASAPADPTNNTRKQETEEEENERLRKEYNLRQSRKKLKDRNRRRSVTVQMRQSRRQSKFVHENLVKLNMFTNIRDVYDGVDETTNKIGEGSWGKVKLVTKKDGSGQTAAVKVLQLSHKMDHGRMRELRGEISMLQQIDHPHIAKLYEIYEEEGVNLYLVQEYLAGGELFDRVIELGYFQEKAAAEAVRQMFGAVQYLHSRGIVHRDLKLENFMYRSPGSDELVLIDFGLSTRYNPNGQHLKRSHSMSKKVTKLGRTMNRLKKKEENIDMYLNEMVGSSYYMAPEVLRRKYGQECDVWSLGVIAYMLLSGHPPFAGENDKIIMKRVLEGKYHFRHSAFRKVSAEAVDFVRRVLEYNPKERLTAREALEHIWLGQIHQQRVNDRMSRRQSIDRSVVQNLKNFVHTNRFKKLALQAVAYSTRYEDIQNLQEIFEDIDQDQDGYITLEELRNALKHSPYVDSAGIEEIFEAMDVDRAQKVHLNEFIAASLNHSILKDENILLEAFNRLDINEKGEIDRNDLADLLGQNFDRRQVDKMLEEFANENPNGGRGKLTITKGQFINAMRRVRKDESTKFMSFQNLAPVDDEDDDSEIEELNL
eukprot:augustus_masked-scaffold_4-processed-gene-19.16-mRNA-1 protein AED:0.09 eAED:0.11 QI:0/-1/0/1/-1/1/1/0/630